MSGEHVLIISPVRNEAAHLPQVIEAVAGQRRRPDRWVIVDDRSEDETLAIARRHERRLPFLTVLQAPPLPAAPGGDRLRRAAEAVAFNWALGQAGEPYDFVGKLDGDVVLAPEHFEHLLAAFDADPALGLAGCFLQALEGGRWRVQEMPDYHVQGAVKLYRRGCFEAIGGVREQLGWDTADEIAARQHGWTTRSFRAHPGRHLKPSGSVGGLLRGRVRHGECVWIVNYPPSIVALRVVRILARRPYVVGGLAHAFGYVRARVRGVPQVPDPELLRYARDEQRRRARTELRGALRRLTSRTGRRPSAPAPPPAPGG